MSETAPEMLRSYVRRIEAIEKEIKGLNDDKSEIYKEVKAGGFDVKVLRKVIAERRKDKDERNEFDSVFELYWNAVHGLVRAHVENIEEFDAETGEISEPQTAGEQIIEGMREAVAVAKGEVEPYAIHEPQVAPQPAQSQAASAVPGTPSTGQGGDESPVNNSQSEAVHDGPSNRSLDTGSDETSDGAAGVEAPAASVIQFNRDETAEERCLRLRPHCQNPSGCGSSVWNKHCFTCTKAVTSLEGGAA